jgi:membrane-bound metal-dependent hydrolase YbcI (DUF457 family)
MFIGHFAVGFALKKAEPKIPLGVWFAAAQFLDILWPIFLLTGIEKVAVVPGITVVTPLDLQVLDWSHSLLMVAVWSVLFGLIVYWRVRSAKAFFFIALAVASHWLLDYATHRPDMPLAPHSARYGLALWNSLAGTLIVEVSMFALAVFIYARHAVPQTKRAWLHLTLLVLFLTTMYFMSIFGPPPPNNQMMIGATTLALVPLVIPWANWVDRKLGLQAG